MKKGILLFICFLCVFCFGLTNIGPAVLADGASTYSNNEDGWIDNVQEPNDYAYSFMMIGDIQVLTMYNAEDFSNKNLEKVFDYVVDNVENKKVECVIGLGDITENDIDLEWNLAMKQIARMDGKVDYTLVRGNHDSPGKYKSNVTGKSDYENQVDEWYEEGNVLNVAHTFEAGMLDYLVICLDYGASDAVLDWAGSLCEKYPYHNVIVTTHAYLMPNGALLNDQNCSWPPSKTGGVNDGDDMWEKFVRKYPNITMVISGHEGCENVVLTQTEGDNGNIVSQFLIDPQDMDRESEEGIGMVSTFYFSEDGKTVTVDWYSTVKEKYYKAENQYTFTVNTVAAAPKAKVEIVGNGTVPTIYASEQSQIIKLSPAVHHHIEKIEVDGIDVTSALVGNTYTLESATENTIIKVTFSEDPKYLLTINCDTNKGTAILPDGVELSNYPGKDITITIRAKTGYEIDRVFFDGEELFVNKFGRVTIEIGEKDSVLSVSFRQINQGGNASEGGNNNSGGASGCSSTITQNGTITSGILMFSALLFVFFFIKAARKIKNR